VITPPQPVFTVGLFAPDRAAFVDLLRSLTAEEWTRPTACRGWTVADVVAHVVGGDLGNLARRRDRWAPVAPGANEGIVSFVNRFNEEWVSAARRISPPLLVDLVEMLGAQIVEYFGSLDPLALGGLVSWAGPDPAPVWLDVAREYTERWLHQQHVRYATGRPGQREPQFMAPVLAAFARALPHAYREVAAPEGTAIVATIEGAAGGSWSVVREGGRWRLYEGSADGQAAQATMADDTAWRLLTRGLSAEAARDAVTLAGDQALAIRILDAVAIIA
jgi:uncharacterized protein (TIGR03083 family)